MTEQKCTPKLQTKANMPGIRNPDIEIALKVVLIRVNGLSKDSKDGTSQAKKGENKQG